MLNNNGSQTKFLNLKIHLVRYFVAVWKRLTKQISWIHFQVPQFISIVVKQLSFETPWGLILSIENHSGRDFYSEEVRTILQIYNLLLFKKITVEVIFFIPNNFILDIVSMRKYFNNTSEVIKLCWLQNACNKLYAGKCQTDFSRCTLNCLCFNC